MKDKQQLREELMQWRRQLPTSELQAGISAALSHLPDQRSWAQARTVAVYAALPGEPDLSGVIERAWDGDKNVVLPITPDRGQPLRWREHQPGVPLIRGRFDVPVPPASAGQVAPEHIDLVIVPGLAVDPRGYRLGYGGGYYDRSLPTLRNATSIWVGLPRQVLAAIPIDAFDVAVEYLLTPQGMSPATG